MQKQKTNSFEITVRDARTEINVWGKTLQNLFLHALQGLAYHIAPSALAENTHKKKVTEKILVEAVDINSLLVEFLSEVIARADIRGAIFTDAAFERFGENFLEGEIIGIETEERERTVEGVSYEELEIKKDPKTGQFEAIIYFM